MDLDGTDAFNRLLERIEELAADAVRRDAAMSAQRAELYDAQSAIGRLKSTTADLARLERFVESTPERQADWLSYIQPKPVAADDDTIF